MLDRLEKRQPRAVRGSSLSYTPNSLSEGSLEVKLPTISTDEKLRWEESDKRREDERREEKRSEEERIKKEKVSEERRSRCAKR
jgi:hypothetical protein